MLQLLEIIIVAVVQGIGEFLPISSSAHIILSKELFEVFGHLPPVTGADLIKLEVVLHLGTLIPVLVIFWRTLFNMLVKDWTLLFKVIAATLPAVVSALLLKKLFPDISESFTLIGTGWIITGFILLSTLKSPDGEKTCQTLSWFDAMLIGCMQAVAVLPGISRFGSTTFAALFRKLEWKEAIKFSFLLSVPVVAGSGILELKDMLEETGTGVLSNGCLAAGMLTSCGFGFLTLWTILRFLPKNKFWCFALWVFLMSPLAFYFASLPKETVQQPEFPDTVMERSELQSGQAAPVLSVPSQENSLTPEEALNKAIENTDNTEREKEKLEKAEAEKEYQRILAEEEAKEQALIAEEQKRMPFVDSPEKLVPLDPKDRIWITPDGKSVVLLGRVSLREGLLELFACRVGSKEHESIVSIRVKPHLIHGALLAINAEQGKPVQQSPEFVPPSGDEIEIKVRWKDEDGKLQETLAQEWVWDNARSGENDKKPMTTHWVFTGSMQYNDEDGEVHYVADETGELFGVSNFVGAVLDVPIKSSTDNADLQFSCFTERIPPLGTPLTLILTPIKNKKR